MNAQEVQAKTMNYITDRLLTTGQQRRRARIEGEFEQCREAIIEVIREAIEASVALGLDHELLIEEAKRRFSGVA